MINGKITLIGAGKLAARFYNTYSKRYEFHVVGTSEEQFSAFDGLEAKNTSIYDTSSILPFGTQIPESKYVVCMVAPSYKRMTGAFKNNKDMIDVYQDVFGSFAQILVRELSTLFNIDHVVWCSSVGVYGNHNGNFVGEESRCIFTKDNQEKRKLLEAEHIINLAQYQGVDVTVLRFGKLFSNTRSMKSMYDIAKYVLNERSLYDRVNLTHEDDANAAIIHCLQNKISGTYNVTNDFNKFYYYELINKITAHFGLERLTPLREGKGLSTNCQALSDAIKETGFMFSNLCTIE